MSEHETLFDYEGMPQHDEPPAGRRFRVGELLIQLSGARPEILERCPTERIKFQSLGWAILITCTMATVSMWFALSSAMGFSPILAFPVAVLWGLIIMGIDRWLVTSMPIDGRRKFLVAVPRLVMALLLGTLISTPIVLRIFDSEINNEISIIKNTNEANFLSSQQNSSIQARVTKWQNTVNNLQKVIDSHGEQPINPSSDPVVSGLTAQLNNERTVASTDYKAWQCQLYGGCNAPKGSGPLAQASQKRYQQDEQRITSLTSQIQTRERDLQATDAASQQNRLQQAQQALPTAQAQLKAAQGEEDSLLGNFQTTNSATNGILIRLQALDKLSAGDSTLQMARFLLFLLFLVIEILPVTVKLLQQPGNYEKILRRVSAKELNKAEWDLRGGPRGASAAAYDDGSLRPGSLDSPAGRRRRRAVRDPLDEELTSMFEQRTRQQTMTGWAASARTREHATRPDDRTGPNRLGDFLRGMADTRADDSQDEKRAGDKQRRYDDRDQF